MGSPTDMYENAERVRRYITDGPPAFTPGHAGLLQMIGVLLAERVPQEETSSSSAPVAVSKRVTWPARCRDAGSSASILLDRCSTWHAPLRGRRRAID